MEESREPIRIHLLNQAEQSIRYFKRMVTWIFWVHVRRHKNHNHPPRRLPTSPITSTTNMFVAIQQQLLLQCSATNTSCLPISSHTSLCWMLPPKKDGTQQSTKTYRSWLGNSNTSTRKQSKQWQQWTMANEDGKMMCIGNGGLTIVTRQ